MDISSSQSVGPDVQELDLFAEELSVEELETTLSLGATLGSVGCFGSVSTFGGTVGSFATASTASSASQQVT